MQLSRYIKIYPWEDGQKLLFSTCRQSKALVPEETLRSAENGGLAPSEEALLSRLGMLVEDREEEKRDVLGYLDRINADNTVLSVTVVLNLDCNFACVYCYEGERKGKLYMSEETGDRLVRFIKGNFQGHKKALLVDFYGGEPLLSLGLIQSISRRLKSFTEGRGASYRFTLVTNGSLFFRKAAEALVPLGLTNVQITLDGPAENHDQYRPFRSGAGSFGTILRNMQETWDLVKIGIGGNYDQGNYERFVSLLDDLEAEGLTPDRIAAVKFAPIMKRPEGEISPVDYREGCMSADEPWLLEAQALLREEILKRGYLTPKVAPTICAIEMRDCYVVNYDGVIYKCPAFIGRPEFAAGDVERGVTDYTATYHVGLWRNGRCAECEYLPLCYGGCRYMAFVRDGSIDRLDCRKGFLDASLETLIKQDIKYGRPSEGR